MSAWKIKAYWLKGGTCPVRDWYRAQAVAVQAEFDATLTTLRAITDWMRHGYIRGAETRSRRVGGNSLSFRK
jgi:hypothetical protein